MLNGTTNRYHVKNRTIIWLLLFGLFPTTVLSDCKNSQSTGEAVVCLEAQISAIREKLGREVSERDKLNEKLDREVSKSKKLIEQVNSVKSKNKSLEQKNTKLNNTLNNFIKKKKVVKWGNCRWEVLSKRQATYAMEDSNKGRRAPAWGCSDGSFITHVDHDKGDLKAWHVKKVRCCQVLIK